MCDWHGALTADQGHAQGPVGFVRFPLGSWLQCTSGSWPSLGEGAEWGVSLHSPSVSLVGVKKRTKVIKNNVNPVWNEVCPLRDQSGGLAAFSAVVSSRGGALVWLAKESSGQQEPGRRGGGLAWVCPVMRLQRG